MRSVPILALTAVLGRAVADTHYMFAGFFDGPTILGIEFDDAANTLTVINNSTIEGEVSKWISLDARLQNLYVCASSGFQSYAITEDLNLEYQSNVTLTTACANANFVAASPVEPYPVFGAPFSTGCSSLAMTVDDAGSLQTAVGNLTYSSTGGVHGLDISADGKFVYSADDRGNAVWVHSYDSETETVEELQYLEAPADVGPRHLAVHPLGQWVYVAFESGNAIGVYARDTTTGLLTYTNTSWPMIPEGSNSSSYWVDEVVVSHATTTSSPKYLIASTRSNVADEPGYVSAFSLDAETGAIAEQLFLVPTTSSGGNANAVTGARFSEEYFAITNNDLNVDSGTNFVEVWKIDGDSAAAVAHLDVYAQPANVAWVS
ncbi:Lactonase, 7-bladed beta-propeller-domain-containing protein [Xylariomycetidae sp. FL2044]|nr:Lactonase, 7-bladed beta-propeller-domain-containing protein [Xylariomycetidae sp. FL2044]